MVTLAVFLGATGLSTGAAGGTVSSAFQGTGHGRVTVGSGQMFRGLSQVESGLATSALVQYDGTNGVYVAVWAGRLDSRHIPGARSEIDYVAGYSRPAGRRSLLDVSVTHYTFPEARRNADWTEAYASLHIDNRWVVAAGAGRNWLGRGAWSAVAEVTHLQPMPYDWTLSVTAGYQQIVASGWPDYSYGELALARGFDAVAVKLTATATDAHARRAYGSLAKPRLTGAVSWRF